MLCHIMWETFTDFSKDGDAFILKVKQSLTLKMKALPSLGKKITKYLPNDKAQHLGRTECLVTRIGGPPTSQFYCIPNYYIFASYILRRTSC